jgi:hypothetical protein
LELRLFRDVELPGHCKIERLHSGSDDRIPPHISEGESWWRSEGRGIDPAIRSARALVEDRLPGVVGSNGIFSE